MYLKSARCVFRWLSTETIPQAAELINQGEHGEEFGLVPVDYNMELIHESLLVMVTGRGHPSYTQGQVELLPRLCLTEVTSCVCVVSSMRCKSVSSSV